MYLIISSLFWSIFETLSQSTHLLKVPQLFINILLQIRAESETTSQCYVTMPTVCPNSLINADVTYAVSIKLFAGD